MSDSQFIPIDATVGTEITHSTTSSLYLFWLPVPADNAVKAELGLDTAVRFCHKLRKAQESTSTAMIGRSPELGGTWTDVRYDVQEGVCLKLAAIKSNYGTQTMAALVLLCSKDAPIMRVTMKLSGQAAARRKNVSITGRFWVLNRDNITQHPNVPKLTKQCAHYSAPQFTSEMFEVIECAPAVSKPMAQMMTTKHVDTGEPVRAGGSAANATVVIKTKKLKRVMG